MATDIFAPYEIAKQLKELEFKEPCIAYYKPNITYTTMFNHYYGTNYDKNDIITAPTWEQVFKWFRERGYNVAIHYSTYSLFNYWYSIEQVTISKNNFETYEQCREDLVLRLIELYKKQNNE